MLTSPADRKAEDGHAVRTRGWSNSCKFSQVLNLFAVDVN